MSLQQHFEAAYETAVSEIGMMPGYSHRSPVSSKSLSQVAHPGTGHIVQVAVFSILSVVYIGLAVAHEEH